MSPGLIGKRLRKGGRGWWLVCLAKGTMEAWAAPAKWARLAKLKEKFRRKTMHSLLVAGTFVLMVLSPCLVAMRSDSSEE
jgi:hypothetical protein